jgi:hypothetical protein
VRIARSASAAAVVGSSDGAVVARFSAEGGFRFSD